KDTLWVYDVKADPNAVAQTDSTGPLPVADPAALALRKHGIEVAPLARAGSAKQQRLYAFAAQARGTPASTLLVRLRGKHLTAQGTIRQTPLGILHKLRTRFLLDLAGTPLRDAGLKQIAGLDRMAGLNLELCSQVTDAGLEHLRPLKHLRLLVLAGT